LSRPDHVQQPAGLTCEIDEAALSAEGITCRRSSQSIRFTGPYYSIGFRLKSVGLDFLALDGSGSGKVQENMLSLGAMLDTRDNDFYTQGPILNPVAGPSQCGFLAYSVQGKTEVHNNRLKYVYTHPETGLSAELVFTLTKQEIRLSIRRTAAKTVKLLDSAVFRIAFNSRKAWLCHNRIERSGFCLGAF
jgi:hypothetical protein